MKNTWRDIPGIPNYQISSNLNVRVKMKSAIGTYYKSVYEVSSRVNIRQDGQRRYVGVLELYRKTFPPKITIKYQSGEGRKKLDRFRVYKHILRFMPEVQIPITPNSEGKFETTQSMKEKGMLVCDSCGHIQLIEVVMCKECNELITIK